MITIDINIETFVNHMSIYLRSSIPFSEMNTLSVSLNYLENELKNCEDSSLLSLIFFQRVMFGLVVTQEMKLHILMEELNSLLT